jgi:hypothetical protein
MSNKSIPSEVVQGVVDLGKDTVAEAIEQGTGGFVKPKKSNDVTQKSNNQIDPFQKKIDDLRKKDQEEKNTGIPSIKFILEQQKKEKKFIEDEIEEKNAKDIQEIQELKEKEMKQHEQIYSSEGSLSATGSNKHGPQTYTRKSKEELVKRDM